MVSIPVSQGKHAAPFVTDPSCFAGQLTGATLEEIAGLGFSLVEPVGPQNVVAIDSEKVA